MLSVASVLIFAVVLFFYLHIQFHLKTSDDLEVYELDSPSKATLEEVCDLRQPARLSFAPEQMSLRLKSAVQTYGAFEVKVRDCKAPVDEDEDPYIPLRLDQAVPVMEADREGKYFTEGNADFLCETGLQKAFRAEDPFLRPYLVASCRYDYMAGSKGARTPLRYEVANRTYLIALSGKAKIKLAPPKTSRYLYPVSDYCNYEFRSPVDPWDPQPQYQGDFDKVKCLDVTLEPGFAFFLPAQWWYSIEFSEPGTQLATCQYSTYMSTVATCPHLLLWALQAQNVKHRIAANLVPGNEHPPPSTQDKAQHTLISTQSAHEGRDARVRGDSQRAPENGRDIATDIGAGAAPVEEARDEQLVSATDPPPVAAPSPPLATVAPSSVSVSAVAT